MASMFECESSDAAAMVAMAAATSSMESGPGACFCSAGARKSPPGSRKEIVGASGVGAVLEASIAAATAEGVGSFSSAGTAAAASSRAPRRAWSNELTVLRVVLESSVQGRLPWCLQVKRMV
jgi:hypothetical protein